MARSKKDAAATAPAKSPNEKVVADILKDFGKGVVIGGDAIINQRKVVIPMSPALDFAHNGGIQEGSFVVLVGPPRCGKTTTSLHFAGKAQQPEYGSREVIYLNAEARLEKRDLLGIARLKVDPPHFYIVQSTPPDDDTGKPGKILTARDYLTIAERFIMGTTRKVIILDSISVMVGETEWTEGLDSTAIGEAQRLFSKFMRRMSQVIATNRHIFIGIVHLYANAGGGMGPKWLEKMSGSAQYGLTTKFKASHFEQWTTGGDDKKNQIGQLVHWKCERSPLGPPGIPALGHLRYGEGIDEVMELIGYAIDLNFVEQSGSWYNLVLDGEKKSVQGKEGLRQFFLDDPAAFNKLRTQVSESLGL
jgi:recombination protein RecA